MEEEFLKLKSLEEINNKYLELMDGCTPYTKEELLAAVMSFYKKLKIADEYQPNSKFEGEIVLIKAMDNFMSLDKDYGLSQVSAKLH